MRVQVTATDVERLGIEAAVQAKAMAARSWSEAQAHARAILNPARAALEEASLRAEQITRGIAKAHGEDPNGSPLLVEQDEDGQITGVISWEEATHGVG